MKLSDGERLILLMLGDLYKHLKVQGEIDGDFVQNTILSDQLWGLHHEYQNLLPGHTDYPEEVSEVFDIFDMYRLLDRHYGYLSPEDKKAIDPHDIKFPGFDSHDTGPHTGIARYIVEELELWPEFKANATGGVHTLDRFQRMLRVFLPIRNELGSGNMTVEQIKSVVDERIHPSQRK
jgi:uncharacterized protein YfbU (UPF0304 family)